MEKNQNKFIAYEDFIDENRCFTKIFIEPYQKDIEWHNEIDIFIGTYAECKKAENNFYNQ